MANVITGVAIQCNFSIGFTAFCVACHAGLSGRSRRRVDRFPIPYIYPIAQASSWPRERRMARAQSARLLASSMRRAVGVCSCSASLQVPKQSSFDPAVAQGIYFRHRSARSSSGQVVLNAGHHLTMRLKWSTARSRSIGSGRRFQDQQLRACSLAR